MRILKARAFRRSRSKVAVVDTPRSAPAVARRALALFAVVAAALGADRQQLTGWLRDVGLWHELTPNEAVFLTSSAPSQKQIIAASWYSERLIVLLWALRLAEMPEANEQCDTSIFLALLPPYATTDATAFVGVATLRPETELVEQADAILELHWQARDAAINGHPPRCRVDLGIIQERHHAINWIIGYDDLPWDEVTTDT